MRTIVVPFRISVQEAAVLDAAVAKARACDRHACRSTVLRELVGGLHHNDSLMGTIADLRRQIRVLERLKPETVKAAPLVPERALLAFRGDVQDYVSAGVREPSGNYALDRFWNKNGRSWETVLGELELLEAA